MEKEPSPVYYSDYLKIDTLLSCQQPKSAEYGKPAHDETLFIIIHQVYELWFKLILHELDSLVDMFRKDYVDERSIGEAVSKLQRIIQIQKILIEQIHVLETMTPLDFLEFRNFLNPASGFQSVQFRLIENKLGLRRKDRILLSQKEYTKHLTQEDRDIVEPSEKEESLFSLVEKWLERTPFLDLPEFSFWQSYQVAVNTMLDSDRRNLQNNYMMSEEEKEKKFTELEKTRDSFAAIFDEEEHNSLIAKGHRRLSYEATHAALFINLYRDEPILHLPFRFLTLLVNVDELMTSWRSRHAQMARRMIGGKIGTGGSSGYKYLKAVADNHKTFSDLSNLVTFLIPRSKLLELPPKIKKKLGFYHTSQND